MDSLPDLPYDNVHKFLAAIGIVLIIPALFVEPVYLESEEILSIGSLALILGVAGWVFESVAIPYMGKIEDSNDTRWKKNERIGNLGNKILGIRAILPAIFIVCFVYVMR